ncbi:MAG: sugar nucleotide-binding protein [Bacteroidota bacterium]
MNNIKILITGATGKLAESISTILSNETRYSIYLASCNAQKIKETKRISDIYNVSILDSKKFKDLCYNIRPDFIINTSGISDFSLCEKDKKLAWDLNVTAPMNLSSICRVIDSHLICFSSDLVFDGGKGPYTEDEKPNPQTYFGKTKHAMENECLYNLNNCTIFRITKLYGLSSYNKDDFVHDIFHFSENEDIIKMQEGRFSNPVFADDIGLAVMGAIEKHRTGVYHLGGKDWLSEIEVFRKTASILGIDTDRIQLIPAEKTAFNVRIMNKFGLITLKSSTDLGVKFTSLENGVSAIGFRIKEKYKWYKG